MNWLRECLADWTDADAAMHELALRLGVIPQATVFATEAKHVYWVSNELGDALFDALQLLVNVGALEYDAEDQRFRSNPAFVWHEASSRPGRSGRVGSREGGAAEQ